MKFGGTSVGSVKSILSLKSIVEAEAGRGPVVVVVSALNGITDKLIATSEMAKNGDSHYREEFEAMVTRHHQMIDAIIQDDKKRIDLFNSVDQLFDQLRSIYYGVFLIHDLSEKTQDTIISYGERLSSHIVAAMIKNGMRMNARDFIRTENKEGKHVLDTELTMRLVKESFASFQTNNTNASKTVAVVPGFIARDRDSHETTNLGRGGSDYTAAIIAAALDAEILEIWTDVDGFMTADPKVIKSAYTINELSYVEAMELCNFGAKVIYPPTIYPVCVKNIPIKVKNTFNPEHPGTQGHVTDYRDGSVDGGRDRCEPPYLHHAGQQGHLRIHGVAGIVGELHLNRCARRGCRGSSRGAECRVCQRDRDGCDVPHAGGEWSSHNRHRG